MWRKFQWLAVAAEPQVCKFKKSHQTMLVVHVRTSAPAAEELDVLFDEKMNLWTETWSYELILKVSIV